MKPFPWRKRYKQFSGFPGAILQLRLVCWNNYIFISQPPKLIKSKKAYFEKISNIKQTLSDQNNASVNEIIYFFPNGLNSNKDTLITVTIIEYIENFLKISINSGPCVLFFSCLIVKFYILYLFCMSCWRFVIKVTFYVIFFS